jgi:hypothetical protein
MEQTLKELGYEHFEDSGFPAWSKLYKGFLMFVARSEEGKYMACIKVKSIEISIPRDIDEYWICDFDSENSLNQ